MSFKPGAQVIWVDADVDPKKSSISYGTVSKIIGQYEVQLEGDKYPRFSAFMYPHTNECFVHLNEQLALAIRHSEEQDAFMKKTYMLNNELVRQGLK